MSRANEIRSHPTSSRPVCAKVGDWGVAVGNPFGLGGTVTAGIISALGCNINERPYDDFLQIDAPINRGNSGGPTFDLHGRVIGINTAIYSPSGGSVGIGFAVPSSIAKNVVDQIREHGDVTWGWLGGTVQNVTSSIAKSLGLDPNHPTGGSGWHGGGGGNWNGAGWHGGGGGWHNGGHGGGWGVGPAIGLGVGLGLLGGALATAPYYSGYDYGYGYAPYADTPAPTVWYWCDPYQGYYPAVPKCPVPWRQVLQ